MSTTQSTATHPAPGAPAHVATIEGAVDSWAVMSYDNGSYSAEEHARLAELVLSRLIPIAGEVTPDGRIVWYNGAPATRQAE